MKSRNTAVALLIADLREELLAPPSGSRAAEHVAMMRLEEQVLESAPRPAARRESLRRMQDRVVRAASARPRRVAALFAAICVLSGSVGLNAAAALPTAVRKITDHITDSIVNTFGVPQPAHSRSAGPAGPRSSTSIDGAQISSTPSGALPGSTSTVGPQSTGVSASAAPDTGAQQTTTSGTPTVDPGRSSGPVKQSGPPPGKKPPPKHDMNRDPNLPPGLPSDWRENALGAARAQLQACTQSTDLAPAGCPQVADLGTAVPTDGVHWTLLNQPLAGATLTAHAAAGTPDTAIGAVISVYGLFQMDAAYTLAGDTQPRFVYSSGIAQATMTWDGSALQNLTFASGSVADHLPDGVRVPTFERPEGVADTAVLAALQPGLATWATAGGGTLSGDPTLSATVWFDPAHGNFTVSGNYTITPAGVGAAPVTISYSATLVFDGQSVLLLAISGP